MKRLINITKYFLLFVLLLIIAYFIGPRVDKPSLDKDLPTISGNLTAIEEYVRNQEASIDNIKPDNEARIIWADSIPDVTEYSLVYFHGWSASQEEGDPIHTLIAKKYGMNLYLPRFAGHGLAEDEPMLDLTADEVIDSAKEALAIAKRIGKKVIIMGCSTGGTLALHLSAGDKDVASLLLYSPNIEIFDPNAALLSGPWGKQLVKLTSGDFHTFALDKPLMCQYWTNKYHVEALPHLQVMVEETMVEETFEAIDQPVFVGYYYEDEEHQDKVVSVPAIIDMFDALGTPDHLKKKVAFTDVKDHVMTSYITSKDLESVEEETVEFLDKILGM